MRHEDSYWREVQDLQAALPELAAHLAEHWCGKLHGLVAAGPVASSCRKRRTTGCTGSTNARAHLRIERAKKETIYDWSFQVKGSSHLCDRLRRSQLSVK